MPWNIRKMIWREAFVIGLVLLSRAMTLPSALALTIDPFYAGSYTVTGLSSVPGVPARYGGLTFAVGNPNTLLMGGAANQSDGQLYAIGVTRDANQHITGFTGSATVFADAAFNDGGVAYGPGGVLFLARWPVNQLGQTKPGSTTTDKIVDLEPLGVTPSPGGVNFVPAGFPGAGHLKIVSWTGGQWYTLGLAPDGTGTYDVTSATLEITIPGGPEGLAYVPMGSPLFPNPSVLVSEYSEGKIATYEIDANGDPILATRRDFLTGLSGAEGAMIDPLTGDFLFSTFGGENHVVVVKGFTAPPPPRAGSLRVAATKDLMAGVLAPPQIALILDASGSMKRKLEGRPMIEIAKEVMTHLIHGLPDDIQVALRVYGHRIRERQRGDCQDSELAFPFAKIDKPRLLERIRNVQALGTTPIAYSLQQVPHDFEGAPGEKIVILVTDGKEECKGNLTAVVSQLLQQGLTVRLNIVGFALADEGTRQEMQRVAALTGGHFFDARDTKALLQGMQQALVALYDVLEASGKRVNSGRVGDRAIAVPVGSYTVVVHAPGAPLTISDVQVVYNQLTTVELKQDGQRIGTGIVRAAP